MAGNRKILFAGGGTAGHLMPAINIANAIKRLNESVQFMFVGRKNGIERQIVEKHGFDIEEIEIIGMKRTLKGIVNFALKWRTGYKQAMNLLNEYDPDCVIGTGGYLSAPVLRAANKLDKMIFIQEQNSIPGLATRTSARFAKKIFTVYESASDYLPSEKCVLVGNPIRSDLLDRNKAESRKMFGLDIEKNTILVLGGSLGAVAVNKLALKLIESQKLPDNWQILWQTGKANYESVKTGLPDSLTNVILKPFIDDMPAAYASADFIISRAGAMALSEITAIGLPSILIPYPHATGDHQTFNAKSLEKEGAAIMISEKETEEKFLSTVLKFIIDEEKRNQISAKAKELGKPDAADFIATSVLENLR